MTTCATNHSSPEQIQPILPSRETPTMRSIQLLSVATLSILVCLVSLSAQDADVIIDPDAGQ
uniref:Uncharacterized protein n=1 Tax=uncultured Rhizobium sp. HF0500_35F13 TaxID=723627 RepID=E7C638_9HYPH|nr:hypothetical protein [uncultured Rhizobium sp. HF0500_35F13]